MEPHFLIISRSGIRFAYNFITPHKRYALRKIVISTVLGWLIGLGVSGQVFELTENKGQWHPDVRYKGELSVGAFFLKKDGYRVLQYQHDDFKKAITQLTGHAQPANPGDAITPFAAGAIKFPQYDNARVNNGEESSPVRAHAYDVVFEGASPAVQILPERALPGYTNYFLGADTTRWKAQVKSYGALRYSGMYAGVDVRYYSEDGYLKYDIIVQPGGRPADIVIRYDGVEGLRVKNGELYIKTSVGEVKERAPYTYQLEDGQRKEIPCRYEILGNRVRFKLSGYNAAAPLVIDPSLVFSTFVGSTSDNWGYTATYDAAGNAYGGGIVFGNGYPTTLGAFQRTFGGGGNTGEGAGFDMALTKLSPNGSQRIYSTLLGGSGNEQPHSLVVDGAGSLIVAGRTTSANFPVTTGGNIGVGGLWDITITKFNSAGTGLIGSVRMGGTDNDGVNIKHKTTAPTGPQSLFQNYGDDARSEVLTDRQNNIYIASSTRSNNFPFTQGAAQTVLRGNQDALLMKFSPNMVLQYATLLGGDGDDAAYVLFIEDDGNVLVAGGTGSNNLPGNRAGTVGANYAGGLCDGFIARVSANGDALLASTYIGTNATDQLYGIQKDRQGFVYVMGTSTGNFPVRNAAYRNAGGKQFIAKLQPDFSAYVYSTVFGPNTAFPNISPTAFLVDRCENVYVSGWGGQIGASNPFPNSLTFDLPVTSDAIQSTTDGRDFYFFVLEKDAARQLYGSFFGQRDQSAQGTPDHVDGGTSRFDPMGVIYQGMCANCSPGQFPTTPGVVAPTRPASATCNLAVVKIAFDLSGVVGGIKSSIEGVDGDTSACVPTTVNFRDTIGMARSYQWNFGDGSPEITTQTANIAYTFNRVGTFRVRLIAIDLNRCFPRDTSFVTIRVRPDRITLAADAIKLDPCESNAYRFVNRSTANPIRPYTDTTFIWNFGDGTPPVRAGLRDITHQFPAPGTYTVRLVLTDTAYCNAPDSISFQLRVSPEVKASFETPSLGCSPYLARFVNTSAGGQSFRWDFGNGQTSTDINPTFTYVTPGIYTVKLVAIDSNTCNLIDSTTFTIDVRPLPVANFTFSPNPPEENILVTYTNLSNPTTGYIWAFGDGDTLRTQRRDTLVRHQFAATGTYTTCLIAFDVNGCADTICRDVSVIVNPLLDVVTAFTPNGDGVNDFAIAKAFGVVRFKFRIFNRWGQMVFETADPRVGWDGRFKGQPQPMDAYAYTLEAELLGGELIKKGGHITLIR